MRVYDIFLLIDELIVVINGIELTFGIKEGSFGFELDEDARSFFVFKVVNGEIFMLVFDLEDFRVFVLFRHKVAFLDDRFRGFKLDMIGKLTVGLAEFFEILFKLVKRSDDWKILKEVVINVADENVADVQNDSDHEADKEVGLTLKHSETQNQDHNTYDQKTRCQNHPGVNLEV